MNRHWARVAGVMAIVAAVLAPAGTLVLSGTPPPACPRYQLYLTGGHHGTPSFVSATERDWRAYAEAIRLHTLGQCRYAAPPAVPQRKDKPPKEPTR